MHDQPGAARGRGHEQPHQDEVRARRRHHERADSERRNAGDSREATREPLELDREHVGDEPEGERGHGQVMAAQAQRGIADQRRRHHREERSGEQRGERRPAAIGGEDGRGVAADGREGVVPERDLPRVAREDVQSHRDDRVDAGEDEDRQDVIVHTVPR